MNVDLGDNLSQPTDRDERYFAKAVGDELARVATSTDVGGRNDQLFRSACSIFGMVKAGLGTKEVAEHALIEAATDSGYAQDEPDQMMATLDSAWRTAQPRDLTAKGVHIRPRSNQHEVAPPAPDAIATELMVGAAPIAEQADRIMQALEDRNEAKPRLFTRNTVITRLLHDPETGTRLEQLHNAALQHEIDRVAHYVSRTGIHVALPRAILDHIAGAPHYPLPSIRGIRQAPYFAANGRLVDRPGYDAETGYYLDLPQGLTIPRVAKHPTPDDITRALRHLLEVMIDFPFADSASKRLYLALLLLAFCRDLIDGPTPIHLFAKPAPGTGASLAVDVFAMIATGRTAAAQAEAESTAEFRKNLTAFLMGGAPYYYLDNLHQSLNDPAFAAALTAGTWQDRVLGKSHIVIMPIRNIWIVAGNNPELSEELARRSVLISLDTRLANPCSRTRFRHPRLLEYVRRRRGTLIWACLTLIQAWVTERHTVSVGNTMGMADPDRLDEFLAHARAQNLHVTVERMKPGSTSLPSFESWAKTMSGVLEHAGVKRGLLSNRPNMAERTTDSLAAMRDFLVLWYARHANQDVRVGAFSKGNQAQNYALVPTPGTLLELLHSHRAEIDLGFNGRPETMWQTRMGAVLSNVLGRVFQLPHGSHVIELRVAKTRASAGVAYRLERP